MSDQVESTPFRLRVECYAGYRSEERPVRFYLHDHCIEIDDIIDQWQGPDHRYFKVRGNDLSIYILRHDSGKDHWEMILFDRGNVNETKLSST